MSKLKLDFKMTLMVQDVLSEHYNLGTSELMTPNAQKIRFRSKKEQTL